ncbi:nitrate reductase [Jiella mangrovi]|uniref:Molybdopterin-dependent oxidoreductase n=1 Tax=Jiella mangrovi TaxID=2821407 RepID=A0ABS4BMV1_9HYPH|nr:nitrate reductase [Jiella mangrovi]MBP0618060.1 molybdopterin-dependent oxidoreductase [Jiella mangrovi]
MDAAPTATTVRTTCAYCGVGCGVLATPRADGGVTIAGDPEHPANFGRLCSKGSALGETLQMEGRLLHPTHHGVRTDWDTALDLVAERFSATIAEYGPDSVAFYVSGQLLTEDYYVANKLMKGFIGSANIDTNSRLCMASSVAGHRRAFGSDTVPGTYEDLELADLVVLVGSNLAWCHPVIYQRLAAAKAARPAMKVVLIDPRRTMTADIADLHLPIAADGDVALFAGLLPYLAEAGAIHCDYVAGHTEGFVAALKAARNLRLAEVAEATGLKRDLIERFYALFARHEKVVTVYSQGVNQSVCGTDKVNAILNCHLATGRIGRPGMGPFSITGQPNAMGGREVGGMANMLAAHMAIEDEPHRNIVRDFWDAPRLAERPGLKAVEMFEAVASGQIRAIWIMGTNPVVSMPDADAVARALAACPFVVVSDVVEKTDTLKYAAVAFPAAAWGEKDGTVTNSERRISRQRAFLPLPGEARPDWWAICAVARRMGFGPAFAYDSPAVIFAEHARLSAHANEGSRDFDIGGLAGLDEAQYDTLAPVQWPQPGQPRTNAAPAGPAMEAGSRFFADGRFYHADQRARFVPTPLKRRPDDARSAAAERMDGTGDERAGDERADSPRRSDDGLILNTGRVRDHWHTMTRTGLSARLSAHIAEPYAEINPADASRLGLAEADLVVVSSPRGQIVVRALVSERQRPGSVFVPMHWTGETSSKGRVDALVSPATDPVSGQPGLKSTSVHLRRFEAVWYGFAVTAERPDTAGLDYFAVARADGGYRLEMAGLSPLEEPSILAEKLSGVPKAAILAYHDEATGAHRFAAFAGERLVAALYLSREPVAVSRVWAAASLASRHAPRERFRLLAGRGGADRPDPGAIVCSCFSVGVNEISAAIVSGRAVSLDEVGKLLKAGTNCGSCRSEIKGIIDGARVERPASAI